MKSLSQSHRGSTQGTNRIVKYIADFEDDNNNYIVMEYCEHGTLRDYIRKKGKLRNEIGMHDIRLTIRFSVSVWLILAASVLSQLVEGVQLIHKLRFMHRDLTASNVLISRMDGDQLFVVSILQHGASTNVNHGSQIQFRSYPTSGWRKKLPLGLLLRHALAPPVWILMLAICYLTNRTLSIQVT